MKLEPVYVVAPSPALKGMPTRRAFLIAGVAGALGFGAGVGVGSTAWFQKGDAAADATGPPRATNERIAWAKQLLKGASDQLLENLPGFVAIVEEAYSYKVDDEDLWQGVRRLAAALVQRTDVPQRQIKARLLLNIGRLRPGSLDEYASMLARIALR